LESRVAFVRALVRKGIVCVNWLETTGMLADLLTKLLSPKPFLWLSERVCGETFSPTVIGFKKQSDLVPVEPKTWAEYYRDKSTASVPEEKWLELARLFDNLVSRLQDIDEDEASASEEFLRLRNTSVGIAQLVNERA
jgi:hypothetical protein